MGYLQWRPVQRRTAGRWRAAAAFVAALSLSGGVAYSQDEPYPGRPGLAGPEGTPRDVATCDTIRRTLDGFQPSRDRVDLWISGPLSLVHTDTVLWYLAVCPDTGIRVMCVTYSDNGMKVGDHVVLAGALEVQDKKHAVLDPCLASRE